MKVHATLITTTFIFLILQRCDALYSTNDHVVQLTSTNFDELVIKSDEVWMVEFYAPWCLYCKNLASEYIKAANALRGIVKVGAIDVDNDKSLPARYGIQGLPTIKIFGSNKLAPDMYNEARSSKQLIEAALEAARALIFNRLEPEDQEAFRESSIQSSDIVELTDENFEGLVVNSSDVWMVQFHAHWCGHCKTMESQWVAAAQKLKGQVKFGKLDGSVNKNITAEYDVTGYPAIKLFSCNKKVPLNYNGARKTNDIVEWVSEKLQGTPLPEVNEILDENSLKKSCEYEKYCIIAFLPELLECPASCRNAYIKTLRTVAGKFHNNPWGWVWSDAEDQPDIQDVLSIPRTGYPKLVAVNHKRLLYSILDLPFSEDNIYNFLNDLAKGKMTAGVITAKEFPSIYAVVPWDGTDGTVPIADLYKNDEL